MVDTFAWYHAFNGYALFHGAIPSYLFCDDGWFWCRVLTFFVHKNVCARGIGNALGQACRSRFGSPSMLTLTWYIALVAFFSAACVLVYSDFTSILCYLIFVVLFLHMWAEKHWDKRWMIMFETVVAVVLIIVFLELCVWVCCMLLRCMGYFWIRCLWNRNRIKSV